MKRLKSVRLEQGLNQEEFAQQVNTSRSTISMYETGKRQPSPDMLREIASALNVSVDYLLDSTDDPSPEPIRNLSQEEQEIIAKFRKLDERGAETIIDLLNIEYARRPKNTFSPRRTYVTEEQTNK